MCELLCSKSQPEAQESCFAEAHNVIIKLLTANLVMAFAKDVKVDSQLHLTKGDALGTAAIRLYVHIYFLHTLIYIFFFLLQWLH